MPKIKYVTLNLCYSHVGIPANFNREWQSMGSELAAAFRNAPGMKHYVFNRQLSGGGVKMAEEQDGEITFSSTNSSKEQENGEESLQNNF